MTIIDTNLRRIWTVMETLKAITSRRSVRALMADPVSEKSLGLIIRAASLAATAGNRQPWTFITICNPKRLKAIRSVSPGMLNNPPAVIVICLDENRAMRTEDGQIDKMAWMDLGAAMENMLLASHDIGLGACPIGSFNEEAVNRLLNLPGHLKSALFIALGVPVMVSNQPEKRPLEEISFYDKYGGTIGQESA